MEYQFTLIFFILFQIILQKRSFYNTALDNNYIYGADAGLFDQNGWSYKYTESGTIVDSVQVGIIPGSYCFN